MPSPETYSSSAWFPGPFGKIFRSDPKEQHLFICTFFNEIQIHYGVGTAEFEEIITVPEIPGKGIVDYVVLNQNLFLVYTSDCFAIIYEYTNKNSTLVYLTQQDMGGYYGINLTSNQDRTHVILNSQKDLHMGMLRIFTVDYKCRSLVQISQLDLRHESIPGAIKNSENYLFFVKE